MSDNAIRADTATAGRTRLHRCSPLLVAIVPTLAPALTGRAVDYCGRCNAGPEVENRSSSAT